MPDPDPQAVEPMDAPGTRVTPDPGESPGHDRLREPADPLSGADGGKLNPDEVTANEGGTGTSGARGGGPASNFTDPR